MGGGGGTTSTQSTTSSTIPDWSVPAFQKLQQQGLANLDAYTANPNTAESTAATGVLSKILDPSYLKVQNDPNLAAVAQNIQRQGAENIAAGTNAAAATGAQTGGLLSVKNNVAKGEVARRGAADIAGQTAQLYANEYDKRQAAQLAAIPTAISQAQLPWQQAITDYSIIRGTGGTSTSTGSTSSDPGLMGWLSFL